MAQPVRNPKPPTPPKDSQCETCPVFDEARCPRYRLLQWVLEEEQPHVTVGGCPVFNNLEPSTDQGAAASAPEE